MKVYEAGFNMLMKFILIVVGIVAFFIVLFKMLNSNSDEALKIYGAFELLLGGTLYMAYKHYFPSKKE
ncbi:hypothetical protein MTQ00_09185 [Chryseobacterium sp. B21-037]|uniref:hypothetical protein n=1 Tax=Chryseobacterium sp. B21-037 TaxID=2926038 RepID=UPI00235A052B|nr:hypothetical protein [Chryseobacterium sp. B21-037]MDC8104712.1 hypothetical protein [Chryseobacterium sp. B21-037]